MEDGGIRHDAADLFRPGTPPPPTHRTRRDAPLGRLVLRHPAAASPPAPHAPSHTASWRRPPARRHHPIWRIRVLMRPAVRVWSWGRRTSGAGNVAASRAAWSRESDAADVP